MSCPNTFGVVAGICVKGQVRIPPSLLRNPLAIQEINDLVVKHNNMFGKPPITNWEVIEILKKYVSPKEIKTLLGGRKRKTHKKRTHKRKRTNKTNKRRRH
jgi:hypothetical protein